MITIRNHRGDVVKVMTMSEYLETPVERLLREYAANNPFSKM